MAGKPTNCVVLMVTATLIAVIGVAAAASGQTTFYVNGTCGDDAWTGLSQICESPDGPKQTIQAGMNAAQTGDTVLVADGRYTGFGNKGLWFPFDQNSTLRSENGPVNCIIDLQNNGVGFFFVVDEPRDAVVDGFTITNGNASEAGAFYFHHHSRVIVRNCIITGNSAWGGGAISCDNDSSPAIINCVITGNSATNRGGAIQVVDVSTPTFINCTITGNTSAFDGGGVFLNSFQGGNAMFINTTIAGNTAGRDGGGIFNGEFGAIVTVANSIIWGNSGEQIAGAGDITVTFSDVQGGIAGQGNIDADPRFVDVDHGDFRLLSGSPVIDAADNTAVPVGVTTDLDGNPRFVDDPDTQDTGNGDAPIVDMGAFEFESPSGAAAELLRVEVTTGVLLGGVVSDLEVSDDSFVHTRSGFGQTLVDLHNMTMIVGAVTTVDNAAILKVTIESRIDEPAGVMQVSLRNFKTGEFERVGSAPVGNTDDVDVFENIDATNFVDAAGNIDLRLKHLVFAPFLAFTFESFIDQTEIIVD